MPLDWLLYGLCGIGGAALLFLLSAPFLHWLRGTRKRFRTAVATGVLVLLAVIVAADAHWRTPRSVAAQLPPAAPAETGFIQSNSCKACHPRQYEAWHRTYHRTMTQPARPETVVAPFDGRVLKSNYGNTARVSRQGDEFWVETDDLDVLRQLEQQYMTAPRGIPLPKTSRRIVMTTGSHFFQAYWMRSENGTEYLQFPWRWHIVEQRWIHAYDVFMGPEADWLASSGQGNFVRVWNGECTLCHVAGAIGGFDAHNNTYSGTQIAELGVTCEACHAPGREHARLQENPVQRYVQHLTGRGDVTIVNPQKCDSRRASEVCGQCHSHSQPVSPRQAVTGKTYRAGQSLADHQRLLHKGEDGSWAGMFWGDGTERAAGREFNGLSASACFLKGNLACQSCHTSHGEERHHLISAEMKTNRACVACHEQYVNDPRSHTHHAADSSGSLCYNCHMPHTSWGLMTIARSHQIDSPRATAIISEQRPNACNLCHLDQSLGWTAEHLHAWFDLPMPMLTEEERTASAGALWLLRGDAGQRAVAALHAAWDPARKTAHTDDWMALFLGNLLADPYSVVRYAANKGISVLPGRENWVNRFDGTPAEREAARKELLEEREKAPLSRKLSPGLRKFCDDTGKIDLPKLEAVWRQRDDHTVRVIE